MKRLARLKANDGDHSISISILFNSKNGLTRDEVDWVVTKAVREISEVLGHLPYTSYGIENTRIRM